MTEAQGDMIIALLEHLVFLTYAIALGVGMIWGQLTWRLIILGKDQRSFW